MDISAFGGYEHVAPDFQSSAAGDGYVAGVNITRYLRFPIAPSLEARVNLASSPSVKELSYLVGIRAQSQFGRRFHPYADFLIGLGTIHFNQIFIPGYTSDKSLAKSIGGGIDIDVVRNFQIKLDFQEQFWKLGTQTAGFSPSLATIGIVYRFPFRPLVK